MEHTKYRRLMQNQYLWCNIEANYKYIIQRAKRLYYLVVNGKGNENLLSRCCNYKLLEKEYLKYINK